jgi:hypothetical protein
VRETELLDSDQQRGEQHAQHDSEFSGVQQGMRSSS